MAKEQNKLAEFKKRLKVELRDAVRECREDIKNNGEGPHDHLVIDREGKIYAYDFVLSNMIRYIEKDIK